MNGAIPPLPNTPSWRGAQLKHRDNFTFIICCSVGTLQPGGAEYLHITIIKQRNMSLVLYLQVEFSFLFW
jgi:hypothetical protein